MAAAQVSFDPSGVENKERLSSRLKEGRALVQNVWSIYRSFLITWAPFRIILLVLIALLRCSAASLPRDCINLGQGYMDFAPPSWVREAAEEALQSVSANHYSHPKGSLRLREALKRRYDTKQILVRASTLKLKSLSLVVPTKVGYTRVNNWAKPS